MGRLPYYIQRHMLHHHSITEKKLHLTISYTSFYGNFCKGFFRCLNISSYRRQTSGNWICWSGNLSWNSALNTSQFLLNFFANFIRYFSGKLHPFEPRRCQLKIPFEQLCLSFYIGAVTSTRQFITSYLPCPRERHAEPTHSLFKIGFFCFGHRGCTLHNVLKLMQKQFPDFF